MSEFFFREPLWLLLALLPLVFLIYKKNPLGRYKQLHHFADQHLLPFIIRHGKHKRFYLFLFAVAWLLACIALAGPFTLMHENQSKQRQAVDIALIVDISPSMAATDIAPNRLQRGLWELDQLIDMHAYDRFSLITFSSNAYTTLPLTFDKKAVKHFLSALDTTLPQRKGSNLSRALELAQRTLAASDPQSRAIVLVTDGEAHSSHHLALAKQLGQQQMPLFILGIGSLQGSPVQNAQGQFIIENSLPVLSKLKRDELIQLAQASRGLYSETGNDNFALKSISERLQQIPARNNYQLDSRFTQQLYPWFLMASLILFSFIFIRRAPALVVCLLIPFSFSSHDALANDTLHAQQALKQGKYQQAENLYQKLNDYQAALGLGAVAYRQQQWEFAIGYFKQAIDQAHNDEQRAKASYNLGNAYAQSGEFKHATNAYENALNWQHNYPRAQHNLNLMQQAAELAQNNPQQHSETSTQQANNAQTAQDNLTSDESEDGSQLGNLHLSESGASPTNTENKIDGDVEQQNQKAPPGTNLASVKENTRLLLEKRFARQDRIDQLSRIEDKPW